MVVPKKEIFYSLLISIVLTSILTLGLATRTIPHEQHYPDDPFPYLMQDMAKDAYTTHIYYSSQYSSQFLIGISVLLFIGFFLLFYIVIKKIQK